LAAGGSGAAPRSSRQHRRAVLFLFATVLIDTIGFGVVLPVLPELVMELTGRGLAEAATVAGWLGFVFAITQFFGAPLLGNLSDRFGRRPVLLLSLLAFGLDYLMMGFAPRIGWLFAGRLVAGAAGAAYVPAYSYLADISPPEKRAANFGLVGAAFGLGFILGPALGGLLGGLGPRAPFFAAAGLSLANLSFGFFALPESLTSEQRRPFSWRRANPLGTGLALRRYPAVVRLAVTVFLWQLAHQSLPSVWSFSTMLRFGWSEAQVGASLAFAGLMLATSQGLLTRSFTVRWGERRAVRLALCAAIVGYLSFAFASAGWMLYAGMTTFLVSGLAMPALNALMSMRVPGSSQGELQGAVAALYGLSSILGPPLMTHLFRASDGFPGAPFVLSALLVLVSLSVLARAAHEPDAAAPAVPA
jgi:DHA1 family tetracycline resistance protein-like MFS transporter